MKIKLTIDGKDFKDSFTGYILGLLLCIIRLAIIMPIIILCLIYCPFLWLLGTKKPLGKFINLWDGLAFNL